MLCPAGEGEEAGEDEERDDDEEELSYAVDSRVLQRRHSTFESQSWMFVR
jgi:hypothetical protein